MAKASDKYKAARACRQGQKRDADREATRREMYDQIERVYGVDDGAGLLGIARDRRERARRQGDPLGLTSRPAPDATAKVTGKAAASVRKARDPLLRGGGTISRLHTQGALGRCEVMAAWHLAELWQQAAGGSLLQALDWRVERVDGGRGFVAPDLDRGALASERELRAVRIEVGARAWQVMQRVIADGESLAAVAMDMEDDTAARTNGGCSRQTRDHVSRLLRSGLIDAGKVLGIDARAMAREPRRA
ncbi:hypothetical protein [Stappia sp.]|uniref:hypothetical protein n=1 Tax=Stappia sp. TaxID=1870903 RepID=UPI003C7A6BAE